MAVRIESHVFEVDAMNRVPTHPIIRIIQYNKYISVLNAHTAPAASVESLLYTTDPVIDRAEITLRLRLSKSMKQYNRGKVLNQNNQTHPANSMAG